MRLLLALMLSLTFLHATTLYGEIYETENFSLLDNVILKFEGPVTLQRIFHQNYSVELPEGAYAITASYYADGALKGYSEDNITVAGAAMPFDIVLLPVDFVNGYDLDIEELPEIEKDEPFPVAMAIAAAVAVSGAAYFLWKRKQTRSRARTEPKPVEKGYPPMETELDEDGQRVMKILKEQEGRMMQRELRNVLNFSESKMSLLMAELEASGQIKRIKKGREQIVKRVKK